MKTSFLPVTHASWLIVALMSVLGLAGRVCAEPVTNLSQFGYQWLQMNHDVQAQRPLLVITVRFGDDYQPDTNYFHDLVFGSNAQSFCVNNYFREISNDRFQWSEVGITRIWLPETNRWTDTTDAQSYYSLVIRTAFASNHLSLCHWDPYHNHYVGNDQLSLLIVGSDNGGAAVSVGAVRPAGSDCQWLGQLAKVETWTTFSTYCHELLHTLGTINLYGSWTRGDNLNYGLTTMGPTFFETCHLDPWHKMQLGWSQPRFFPLTAGGSADIPVAQLRDPAAPVLLYDPERAPQEFFLLEYRSPESSAGSPYDTNAPGTGMVLWHVQQDEYMVPLWLADAQNPANSQTSWWYCPNCFGLHYLPDSVAAGACPAGGTHSRLDVADYRLPMDNPSASGESGWRLCSQCKVLFYGPNQASSHCPAGVTHLDATGSDYTLLTGAPRPYESAWRRCTVCQGLFHTSKDTNGLEFYGVCPAGGQHQPAATAYSPPQRMDYYTVAAEGAPDLAYGANALWANGASTPLLRSYDGTPSPFIVGVHLASPATDYITVEWRQRQEVWVDFNYLGFEDGGFLTPFNTLAEGVAAIGDGGVPQANLLHIKAGSSSETAHITKSVRLQSYGGSATIGR